MEAITRVGVVGLGTMGAGIAQVLLEGGCEVVGRDVDEAALERARARIEAGLARRVEKGLRSEGERDAALARLTLTRDLPALAGCELVIEAIVEEIGAKRELFAALDGICGARGRARDQHLRHLGHGDRGGERAARALPRAALLQPGAAHAAGRGRARRAHRRGALRRGLRAHRAPAASRPCAATTRPGFVVNRLLVPALNDAVRALDEIGVSRRPRSTRAMTAGAGWPMGPFRLIDLIGIDVHVHAAEALHAALPEPRMAPPPRLRRMLDAGLLGRKTGRGFYDYGAAE